MCHGLYCGCKQCEHDRMYNPRRAQFEADKLLTAHYKTVNMFRDAGVHAINAYMDWRTSDARAEI